VIRRNLRGGDAMLIADYIAISVLIVLTLWAGTERFREASTLFSRLLLGLPFDGWRRKRKAQMGRLAA
jgi:hypothetical protein